MSDLSLSDTSENLISVISLHVLSRAKCHFYKSPLRIFHKIIDNKSANSKNILKDGPKKLKFNFEKVTQNKGDTLRDFQPDFPQENETKKIMICNSSQNQNQSFMITESISSDHLILPQSKNLLIKAPRKEEKQSNQKKLIAKKFEKLPRLPYEVEEEFASIDYLPNVSQDVFNKLGFNLTCKKKSNIDKTIYIDLDGTLIHKMDKEMDYTNVLIYKDCIKKLFVHETDTQVIEMDIIIRPYAIQFLNRLSSQFELIIYTAGGNNYAKESVKNLDPFGKNISQVLCRGQCALINKKLVKDVRLIKNRKIEKSIILDNCVTCFYTCINNGIYIPSFDGDCKDEELKKICPFLEKIKNCEDVRLEIKKEFRLEDQFNSFQKKRQNRTSFYRDYT